jgi:lipopolysaccharide/colanic/teichoic acid biosynthesis glycosyltransferase
VRNQIKTENKLITKGDESEKTVLPRKPKDFISCHFGPGVKKFIALHLNLEKPENRLIATSTQFNIETLPSAYVKNIVNIKRINDIRRLNKFFVAVNEKLPIDGIYIGCCETLELRQKRLLRKYPWILNRIYVLMDFIFKRVIPKLPITKNIYFGLTGGRNRILSRAETLGRLYSTGFSIIDEKVICGLYFFVAKKISKPLPVINPSYGAFFKMKRTGKNGKTIYVYKMRTMYPFSEYLQPYVYEKNKLDEGGKFKDDFRISVIGSVFRALWIDELPMLINVIKGDLKLVGVRPLSKQYQTLYPPDFLKFRHKFKPGLIPPYYADMPKGIPEIVESERRYLESYQKNRFSTDFRYFWKAFYNIVFKRARSK